MKMNYSVGEDSTLYIAKKILVEDWRDNLSFPAHKLTYIDMDLKDLLHLIWDLFIIKGFDFGINTTPDNLLIEADDNFWFKYCIDWKLVDDYIEHEAEDKIYLDFDLSENNELEKYVKDQMTMFATNKALISTSKVIDESKPEYLKISSFRRHDSNNYYSYEKQKRIIIEWITKITNIYENEYVVLNFEEINDNGVDILRSIICLEYDGLIKIVELDNRKENWNDKSNVYAKILLTMPEEFGLTNKQQTPEVLPDDCLWKGSLFICGNKTVDFNNSKILKYFKLFTENIGKPILNESYFKEFGYSRPIELSRGVKKDLTRKLKQEKLLSCPENIKGRISIIPISKSKNSSIKKAGYICTINKN